MSKISAETRKLVGVRANGKCEYCQSLELYSITTFAIDHVIPSSKDGSNSIDNLAWSCQQCNNHKKAAIVHPDPVTTEKFAIFNPRSELWSEHFAWDVSCTRVVGMTGTGRATVDRLKLNRKGLINLRQLLFEQGLHP